VLRGKDEEETKDRNKVRTMRGKGGLDEQNIGRHVKKRGQSQRGNK
jgi:hypothetical protein